MRKKVGIALLALGAFVLVLAGVAKFYAYDRLAVAPLDRNASTAEGAEDNPTVAEGEGTIFSLAEGFQEIQTTVTSTRNTVGQVDDSNEVSDATGDDVVIYATFSYTTDGEGRVLSGTFDRVPFDRHTGETYDCPDDVADVCDEKTGSVVPETVIERLVDRFGTDDLTQIAGDEGDIAFLRPGDEGFDG
ncbi:MAG: porin PorA family protein, partial [Nocardioidaceae bacterium]